MCYVLYDILCYFKNYLIEISKKKEVVLTNPLLVFAAQACWQSCNDNSILQLTLLPLLPSEHN